MSSTPYATPGAVPPVVYLYPVAPPAAVVVPAPRPQQLLVTPPAADGTVRVDRRRARAASAAPFGRPAPTPPRCLPAPGRRLALPVDFPLRVDHDFNPYFENWAATVSSHPQACFYPKTAEDIQAVVRYAKAYGRAVRCVGYGHSWTPQFANDGDLLVSNLPRGFVAPHSKREVLFGTHPDRDATSELGQIRIVGHVAGVNRRTFAPETKALVRIGSQVTNEHMRLWSVGTGPTDGQSRWTLPYNVVLRDNTIAGVVSNMCHGAGLSTETMADLVHEIEFINANGERQTVSDPALITAAAGSFGLFGPIVSMTLRLDPMTYARTHPCIKPMLLGVPPPSRDNVPASMQREYDAWEVSGSLMQARMDFLANLGKYYFELFRFANRSTVVVHAWDNDGEPSKARETPGPKRVGLQQSEGVLGRASLKLVAPIAPPRAFARIRGKLAEPSLADCRERTTPMSGALHFREGIHNMRVRCMEILIPIPRKRDGTLDWEIILRAWWDAVRLSEDPRYRDDSPVNLVLEARVMGGSGAPLAPEFGNEYTLSIEILGTCPAGTKAGARFRRAWHNFSREIFGIWSSYRDDSGNYLNVRPHLAKEWMHLSVTRGGREIPLTEYLPTVACAPGIAEFRAKAAVIAAAGGYTVDEMQRRFGNDLWRSFVFGAPAGP